MAEENSILGRGWAFPVRFSDGSHTAELSEEETDVRESLIILLKTSLGERVMRPEYGANMENMLFESVNVTTATMITNRLKRAILFHEPRVKAKNIDLVPDLKNGRLEVTVEYTITATNTRSNLVFPYYLDEATNV